ncbi:MAG: hypothetical protein HY889_06855 [Deltaproteobacteria bacterium]|nr:hypothetical protein [Deltaproteobacteria bacterium]
MNRINWRKNEAEALNEIKGGTRLLFRFLYSPECEGSQKTIDDTFSDEKVIALIERDTAPVMINIAGNKELAKKHHVDWTPAFVIADEEGEELERFVGCLAAAEFMAQFLLSRGLADFHIERYKEAASELEELIDEFPDSELVPEAEYFLGAANFKVTGSAESLGEVCQVLTTKYPESLWTKRCSIWAHMPLHKPFVGYDQGGSAGSGAY